MGGSERKNGFHFGALRGNLGLESVDLAVALAEGLDFARSERAALIGQLADRDIEASREVVVVKT
jgi:hypothetical protein